MNKNLLNVPIRVDEACYRGDSWTRAYEPVAYPPDGENVGPVDMTGWAGKMQIRDAIDGAVYLTASSGNGRITTGPQDNGQGTTWQLMVHLTNADTAALPAGFVGRYDIELTKADGAVVTFYYGAFTVEGDVTK